jgi:hypothetical protein
VILRASTTPSDSTLTPWQSPSHWVPWIAQGLCQVHIGATEFDDTEGQRFCVHDIHMGSVDCQGRKSGQGKLLIVPPSRDEEDPETVRVGLAWCCA